MKKNLIQINSEEQEWMPVNTMTSASKAYCSRREQWKYDPSELRRICTKFEYNKSWKSLPFGTIRRIRELRLNRKPKMETQAQSTSRRKESLQEESYTGATF